MHWIDPDWLPETAGVVERLLQNAEGEVDGFLLTDGTEVHVPPHMGAALAPGLQPGSAVRVQGVRPRGAPGLVAAVAVAPERGARIVDAGPPEDEAERKAARKRAREGHLPLAVEGVLRQLLHGPKGEVRGVLLADGSSGRFPPHAALALLPWLRPSTPLALAGLGFAGPHGAVLAIHALGPSPAELQRIGPKPPRHHRRHEPEHAAAPPVGRGSERTW